MVTLDILKQQCHDWVGHRKISCANKHLMALFAEYTTEYWCIYNRANLRSKGVVNW